jgi:rhamnosyltransferase subunit B
MAPKFVFSGTGTRGDLIPMVAMAAEMQERGHACHVLANEPAGALARERGVPFTSTGPAQSNNLTGVERAFGDHVFPSYRPTFEYVERELAGGAELVIVNAENYAGSTLMAERHRLPLCRYILAPFRIFSLEQPFYPLSVKARGRLGFSFRRYTLPKLKEQRYAQPFILRGMNEFRAELGLAPIARVDELEPLASQRVCLFPDWYCAPAADWPRPIECVGFPLAPSAGTLPEALSRFIDERGEPLVFTPGTGVVDVQGFFEAARQCCELLQRPGVFLSPNLAPGACEAGGLMFPLGYLELGLLLPRAALLVHHGGIGTTARALEAAVPQIISPQAFDQPDNGDRVTRLGVGAMIAREQLTGERLAQAARALLDDSEVRLRLADTSRRVRSQSAIAALADILERDFVAPKRRQFSRSVSLPHVTAARAHRTDELQP